MKVHGEKRGVSPKRLHQRFTHAPRSEGVDKRVKGGDSRSVRMLSERPPCAPERGYLEIDNGASERADRAVAVGRGNWTFFGSDQGGRTAAVPLSFVAPASGAESNRSPGSARFSRGSPCIRCTGSPSRCHITGRRWPRVRLDRAAENAFSSIYPMVSLFVCIDKRGSRDAYFRTPVQ